MGLWCCSAIINGSAQFGLLTSQQRLAGDDEDVERFMGCSEIDQRGVLIAADRCRAPADADVSLKLSTC